MEHCMAKEAQRSLVSAVTEQRHVGAVGKEQMRTAAEFT